MVLTLLPALASAETVNALYRVTSSRAEFSSQPGGTPVGIIPVWTNVEIMSIEGDYAKFSYKGYNYYTKVRNLEKLDEPDYICSSWAQNAVEAYVTTHGNSDPSSYKKPITRAEMAAMLVDDIMTKIRGWFQVWQTLPGVISDTRLDQIMTKEDNNNIYWFQISRLLYWGIVPAEKFRPNDCATYKEFTDALVKIVKYEVVNRNQHFSKAIIDSFGVGGDTSPNAKSRRSKLYSLSRKLTIGW